MSEILTPRLRLRRMTPDDVDALSVHVALPGQAEGGSTGPPSTGGPTAGEWYRAAIVYDGALVGAVGAGIRDGGGVAEIGVALHPDHRGQGFAAEATAAIVDDLIEHHEVHRVEAGLTRGDVASMRVLEAIGLTFEVVAREARRSGTAWEDDLRYAMTSGERLAWRERPRGAPETVDLVEITTDDVYDWCALATHYSEQRFVDTMPVTFMEALFPEEFEGVDAVPWMRGVRADGDPVAFVMTSETHGHQEGHFLWRMLVDRMHQRRGIGRRALVLLLDHLRAQGVPRLFTSCGQGVGTPQPFYESLGFRPTGRLLDDEVELVVDL